MRRFCEEVAIGCVMVVLAVYVEWKVFFFFYLSSGKFGEFFRVVYLIVIYINSHHSNWLCEAGFSCVRGVQSYYYYYYYLVGSLDNFLGCVSHIIYINSHHSKFGRVRMENNWL